MKGSILHIPPADLEALADLLEALVPGNFADADGEWQAGWLGCCLAIREVGRPREANDDA